jgi:hypothetical protein
MGRELQLACAHAAYCNAQNFEELYQNFVASPWMYAQAQRYRSIIHNAIRSHDWALLGLRPKGSDKAAPSAYQQQSYFGMR